MINREIVYERSMTGSFMKIAAGSESSVDERLMLRHRLPGVLQVEKAYVDGGGQYWYNISGKQSLDTYCRVKEVGMQFVEQLIISICSLMERLEWNLICANCLMLDPELVFIGNASREFVFTLYPGGSQTVEQEFQILMEYLMKKIDHKDAMAVRTVYQIYEETLKDGYRIVDIRSMIHKESRNQQEKTIWDSAETDHWETMRAVCEDKDKTEQRGKRRKIEEDAGISIKNAIEKSGEVVSENTSVWAWIKTKLIAFGILQDVNASHDRRKKSVEKNRSKRNNAKEQSKKHKWSKCENSVEFMQEVIYPEENSEKEYGVVPEIHPTVCLSSVANQPKGELRYTGSEEFSDILLKDQVMRIGYGRDADICINRETISQFHARIHKEEDGFYIEDLNSTNGTFVNEEPLAYKEQRKLAYNDIVQFADIRYRFC